MIMRHRVLILLLAGVLSFGFARADSFSRVTSDYFGTVSMLRLYDTEGAQEIWTEVKRLLADIEHSVSVSAPDSDIALFNRLPAGQSMPISDITADLFQCARQAYTITNGLYDPSVYPLVDLWGFSPRFNTKHYRPELLYDRPLTNGYPAPPNTHDIDTLLPLVGLDGIELSGAPGQWLLSKHTPAVTLDGIKIEAQIDLGGIAKGYACDRVRELLLSRGCTEGYFICGDSSMTFLGSEARKPYTISIGKPRPAGGAGNDYAQFTLSNGSLATSSDAAHAYDAEGVHWCHLIDPRTGWPINRPDADGIQSGAATVTVIGKEAAALDALSTALCVMGPDEASHFMTCRSECMIMAVWHSDSEDLHVLTHLPPDGFELLDSHYRFAEQ